MDNQFHEALKDTGHGQLNLVRSEKESKINSFVLALFKSQEKSLFGQNRLWASFGSALKSQPRQKKDFKGVTVGLKLRFDDFDISLKEST